MADSIVNIVGLRKRFGTNEVLKGIDLDVKRGEVVAIIGKSGSGKSTLLRCINGLEDFQEGSLEVEGAALKHGDARAMRELRQHVGMIFQSFNLFPHLTVGRNVMLAPMRVKARAMRRPPRAARTRCSRASDSPRSSAHGRTSCRAASSSAWRSRARWRWSRASCCATRSPRRSIRNWWARC